MKKLNLLLLLLLPFLFACNDECEGIDCLSEDAFAFTIKSAETGEDLLFGNNATLEQGDVEVYYMQNGTKQPAQIRFETDQVVVAINPEVTAYYITALDQTDALNFAISNSGPSECCPRTQAIEQITVNNQSVPSDSWPIILTR
ncbi:hypothetical protein [uncultured Pontibacter sp.]|uniref:hypothetical protein n=1 Tax=uncultured Pontibacter sp. TaxID=453356 RepID=UPI00261AC585|nr:hypothetical protein [uncultured Pontibacter sp.]